MKYAYVTLLSSIDYLDGIAVLALSLQKVQSKYPLVVAITEEVASEEIISFLQRFNCIIKIIKSLEYSANILEEWKDNSVLNTASKLQIFGFYEWDKLVYIDGDMLVLSNIDELFNYLDGSILYDEVNHNSISGLFVIEPKNHSEIQFLPKIIKIFDILDGDVIDRFWFQVKSNPQYRIPFLQYFCEYNPNYNFYSLSKIVHFHGIKPWKDIENKYFLNSHYVIRLYKQYLNEVQQMK